MKTTMNIAAAIGFAAVAVAEYTGYAQVINACADPIYIQDVPAINSLGIDCISHTLKSGQGYSSRNWVALATGGFSIKMSPNEINEYATDGIVQYEWNMNAPPTLWWDVSNVNDIGNTTLPVWSPYSSDSSCTASFKSYVYPTDDTAMQASCESTDVVMTVLLCSDSDAAPGLIEKFSLGSGSGTVAASTVASSATAVQATTVKASVAGTTEASTTPATPVATTEASTTPSTIEEATSTTTAANGHHHNTWVAQQKEVVQATTLATSAAAVASPATTAAASAEVVWVTDVQTAYETKNVVHTVVVESDGTISEKHKRHEHRHPHGRKH